MSMQKKYQYSVQNSNNLVTSVSSAEVRWLLQGAGLFWSCVRRKTTTSSGEMMSHGAASADCFCLKAGANRLPSPCHCVVVNFLLSSELFEVCALFYFFHVIFLYQVPPPVCASPLSCPHQLLRCGSATFFFLPLY